MQIIRQMKKVISDPTAIHRYEIDKVGSIIISRSSALEVKTLSSLREIVFSRTFQGSTFENDVVHNDEKFGSTNA